MTTEEYRNIVFKNVLENQIKFQDRPIEEWTSYYDSMTNELMAYMEYNNNKHGIFESSKNKTPHSHFWEVLIGNMLLDAGYDVKRDVRDAAPDYFFKIDDLKIHIEAKAPTEGNRDELKPAGIVMHNAMDLLEEDSF